MTEKARVISRNGSVMEKFFRGGGIFKKYLPDEQIRSNESPSNSMHLGSKWLVIFFFMTAILSLSTSRKRQLWNFLRAQHFFWVVRASNSKEEFDFWASPNSVQHSLNCATKKTKTIWKISTLLFLIITELALPRLKPWHLTWISLPVHSLNTWFSIQQRKSSKNQLYFNWTIYREHSLA